MKKLGLCLVISILIVSLTSIVPAQAEVTLSSFEIIDVYWGTDQPAEVSPGDVETLTVVLRYESSWSFTNFKADLYLPDGFKVVGGDNKATTYYTGAVSFGSIVKLSFPIFIGPDVEKGSYAANLRLEYIYLNLLAQEKLEVVFEVTGKPTISVKVLNDTLYEGKQQVLIATYNDGDESAKNVKIVKVSSVSAIVELLDAEVLGDLEPGGHILIPLSLFVPLGMTGKILPLAVEVNYLGPRNVVYTFSETLQLPVKLSSLIPPLSISLNANELSIGATAEVNIDLINRGSYSLSEIELTLSPDNTLKLFGPSVLYIGTLDSGDNKQIQTEVYVPSATVAQTASLTITAKYFDEDLRLSQSEARQFSMFLRPSNPMSPLKVDLIPRELSIGKSSKLYVDLENIDDHNLSDIRLTLSPDNILQIFGPTVLYIDTLVPEESKRIETEVYVPSTTATPTASLTVAITYVNEKFWLSQSESYKLSILLRGLIEISLTDAVVIPATPSSGSPFSVTVTVTNIGTSTAYAVYAIPSLEDLPLNPFGPRSTYIGNVEVNLPTTFTVNLQVGNTTSKSITLPITLSYMDNLRSLHNITFNIPINVALQTSPSSQASQQRGYPLELILVIGIVTVVVITAIIIVVKKRRKTR